MSLFNFWKKEENNLFDENITIEETRFVVLDTETTGFDYYVKFKTANGELFTARVPEPFPHVAGDMVCLTFKPSEIRLFDADTELAIQ